MNQAAKVNEATSVSRRRFVSECRSLVIYGVYVRFINPLSRTTGLDQTQLDDMLEVKWSE
jgi:hypothetical protein